MKHAYSRLDNTMGVIGKYFGVCRTFAAKSARLLSPIIDFAERKEVRYGCVQQYELIRIDLTRSP